VFNIHDWGKSEVSVLRGALKKWHNVLSEFSIRNQVLDDERIMDREGIVEQGKLNQQDRWSADYLAGLFSAGGEASGEASHPD
jgi:hypothetical protein